VRNNTTQNSTLTTDSVYILHSDVRYRIMVGIATHRTARFT
jgi:hypothetical protein